MFLLSVLGLLEIMFQGLSTQKKATYTEQVPKAHEVCSCHTQDTGGEMKSEPTPTGGSLPSTKEHCLTQDQPGITTKWVFLILSWVGAVASLLECLPDVHKALGSIPAPHRPDGVVLTCNSST